MKNRILAACWFAFVVGTIIPIQGFEARLQYEVFTAWQKVVFILIVAGTMLFAFDAGKEQERKKK